MTSLSVPAFDEAFLVASSLIAILEPEQAASAPSAEVGAVPASLACCCGGAP